MQHRAVIATHLWSDLHPSRQTTGATQVVHDRSKRWKVIRRRWKIAASPFRRRMDMSGHCGQTGLHVIGIGVAHRTNHGQLVHQTGTTRQQFADLRAGNAGGNGAEFTALVGWTVRFRVPSFLLGVAGRAGRSRSANALGRRLMTNCRLRPIELEAGSEDRARVRPRRRW